MSSDAAERAIRDAIAARVFPAAAAEAGTSAGPLWAVAEGTLTFDPGSRRTELHTPFDLASLTKVIATTSVVMPIVADHRLRLDERLATCFDEWRGADREMVTVRDLLEHASGLPARLVDPPPQGRREFEHEICTMPLEYTPRERSIYSDLGFILLGFIAADRGGASLAAAFNAITVRLPPSPLRGYGATGEADTTYDLPPARGIQPPWPAVAAERRWRQPDLLAFDLSPDVRRRAAPTMPMNDDARRGRMLVGEVHDNYAVALGGVAGHAGLFGTAPAVGAFARVVLRAARGDTVAPPFSATAVAQFTARSAVAGSSRALGWDTMLPTSSCGTRMSASAFGHVGFTGTSLWIDPARDRYFVLLTNRACGGGTLDQMREVRRTFHDALGDF
jgi:CubicO group peptidase (beta-lactamase class C family)